MESITERAFPRAGLLGNPSDGYGGRVIAFTFEDFSARVTVARAPALELQQGPGSELLGAALEVLRTHLRAADAVEPDAPAVRIAFESDIPRQAGLAGSSAIVIAALRALCRWWRVTLDPAELAELALRAETDLLGIAAGPQDRVVQSYEGLLDMDFSPPRSASKYRRLDPALLPPLFVAWDPHPGESSGIAHDDVRARFERGDPDVRRAMEIFPRLAAEGARCLLQGDPARLRELVDANYDTRASIWRLREVDRDMVAIGRAAGAGVKFCGSGGAVLGVLHDELQWPEVSAAYRRRGFPSLRPRVSRPRA